MRTIRIKKGQDVLTEGSLSKGIYFISSGKIILYKGEADGGHGLIMRLLRRGDVIGHRSRERQFLQPLAAKAIEDTYLCYINHQDFSEAISTSPALAFSLLNYYEDELTATEEKAFKLANMKVKQKIADTLLTLHLAYGETHDGALDVRLSREDLARISGTTKEQVSKAISELKEKQIIQTRAKRIELLDKAALHALALNFS
jgi:CRP-like cAMP-binding protein